MKLEKDGETKRVLLNKNGYSLTNDGSRYIRKFYGATLENGKHGVTFAVISRLEVRLCSVPKLNALIKRRVASAETLLINEYRKLNQAA